MRALLVLIALLPAQLAAETLVAARTIPARTILAVEDLEPGLKPVAGAVEDPADAIGMEARITIYKGFPIFAEKLAAPALVERNAKVILLYRTAGLSITAEGRALARAGAGEVIRVMNVASRTTVTGTVTADGTVIVAP
ncbi:flagellar basal body P-ring formation chaperone FlgA [Frigidibacter sp. RF13]|uniref:flagellar basal body P-ring formation chaperone FlgA n=1 Tax=Frigidibacter sp. RF13 TaxID=2997340 RepID=UPI00226FC44E|nr:flagellar basal body P-ring formation chaperone FlgA [Frigidibacter sp. RF13]MCY1128698.1 flagellar basal body P-ring formation chaperone FlgA [Frigidibacter sp. RF13]